MSRCYKFRSDYRWEGVPTRPYKDVPADWARAVRCVLIGAGQEATDFHLRYFELAPGGYTSLEKHNHAHVIVAVRGKGIVVAVPQRFDVVPLDTVYIAPEAPHQIINASQEPFGFLCIVDAVRDRPRALSPDERCRLLRNPTLRDVIRIPADHSVPGPSCQPVGEAHEEPDAR
jgi:quercetin dioxygenase-like cupin family protein